MPQAAALHRVQSAEQVGLDEARELLGAFRQDVEQTHLGERGIFVWDGNYYAVEVTRELGLEPDGMVRVGILHYNTADEVDRLLDELRQL